MTSTDSSPDSWTTAAPSAVAAAAASAGVSSTSTATFFARVPTTTPEALRAATLRLKPDDLSMIEKVGTAVIAELDGPGRIHRRTLSRLKRLDQALRQWNTTPQRAAVVQKFRSAVAQACAKSPGDLAGESGCRGFGAPLAAT